MSLFSEKVPKFGQNMKMEKSFQLQTWRPRETAYNRYWCQSTTVARKRCAH